MIQEHGISLSKSDRKQRTKEQIRYHFCQTGIFGSGFYIIDFCLLIVSWLCLYISTWSVMNSTESFQDQKYKSHRSDTLCNCVKATIKVNCSISGLPEIRAFWHISYLESNFRTVKLRYNKTDLPFCFMFCSNMHRMVHVLFSHVSTLK